MYLYQCGRYIATCKPVARYNEATAEQTDADREAYTSQAKYVAKFDKMMKDGKIRKVSIIKAADSRAIADIEARPVVAVPVEDTEEDLSEYMDARRYGRQGRKSV